MVIDGCVALGDANPIAFIRKCDSRTLFLNKEQYENLSIVLELVTQHSAQMALCTDKTSLFSQVV